VNKNLLSLLFFQVTNLNAALEKLDAAVSAGDVSSVIALQGALKFNGGGNINHCLFWENLSPGGGELKDGPLKSLINECYNGGVEEMKEDLNANTIAIQGSGWGWLGYNPVSGMWLFVSAMRLVRSLFVPY
jgi:Fe-Mn family superoxide dismutase